MAKKINPDSLIFLELEKLENKVHEFQKYLELNPIISKITNNGTVRIDEIELTEDAQDKLHKEIIVQIKIQTALFEWLPLLEKLKTGEKERELETRGDVPLNGMFKNKK